MDLSVSRGQSETAQRIGGCARARPEVMNGRSHFPASVDRPGPPAAMESPDTKSVFYAPTGRKEQPRKNGEQDRQGAADHHPEDARSSFHVVLLKLCSAGNQTVDQSDQDTSTDKQAADEDDDCLNGVKALLIFHTRSPPLFFE